ncbi:MAG: stage II sporulation protein M [Candidatus Electrothrix scaldis]|nr:MAG: stage II sporulation protein M [Candidatus Electrothrix sp. GW3-3]
MILNIDKFITEERPFWEELETFLQRSGKENAECFSLEEIRRFHYLYQRCSAGLGRLATFSAEPETRGYLENLIARAYAEIHERRRTERNLKGAQRLFRIFPQTFRRHIKAFCLVLIVTLLGAAFGGFVLIKDPQAKTVILPFSHLQNSPDERVADEMEEKGERLSGHQAEFAGSLMTHNIKVAIFAMGLGLTFGIGTLISLFYNGIILGAVAVDYILAGQGTFLTGWLLPHGSIEIPAFLVAGQAGLVLAQALIGYGDRTPAGQRLRRILPDLTVLIGGVAVMLIWAGLVESFFSQYHEPVIPYSIKISFGVAELLLLILYLGLVGKRSPEQHSPSAQGIE